jgi:hypothetical protein
VWRFSAGCSTPTDHIQCTDLVISRFWGNWVAPSGPIGGSKLYGSMHMRQSKPFISQANFCVRGTPTATSLCADGATGDENFRIRLYFPIVNLEISCTTECLLPSQKNGKIHCSFSDFQIHLKLAKLLERDTFQVIYQCSWCICLYSLGPKFSTEVHIIVDKRVSCDSL